MSVICQSQNQTTLRVLLTWNRCEQMHTYVCVPCSCLFTFASIHVHETINHSLSPTHSSAFIPQGRVSEPCTNTIVNECTGVFEGATKKQTNLQRLFVPEPLYFNVPPLHWWIAAVWWWHQRADRNRSQIIIIPWNTIYGVILYCWNGFWSFETKQRDT